MTTLSGDNLSTSHHYRPDIDGLRCWAILPVVAYHAGLPGVTGGFIGVDIFFVISGFLITSLVRNEILAQKFNLKDFYARRARRLFPALFFMMAVSSVLAWLLLMPDELEDFGESLATASAFSSNILFWSEAGYFEGPSDFKPLLHTWSLAVEEHFYLLFPALLLAIRNQSFRNLIAIITGLAIASFAMQMYYIDRSPDAAFFLSPNRFWELLIGSITAVALYHSSLSLRIKPVQELLAIVGISCLLYSIFVFDNNTRFPGNAALLPCIGTALLIITGANGTTLINRGLQWRPLVAVGLISYSLYLWHWPVLVFLKHITIRPPSAIETTFALIGSGVLAWLSWRFIERPFHTPPAERAARRKTQSPKITLNFNRKTFVVSGGAMVVLMAFGLALDQRDGAPNRLPLSVAKIAGFANDIPKELKPCTGKSTEEIATTGFCEIGIEQSNSKEKGTGAKTADFLLWGDSHGMVLVPSFMKAAQATNRLGLNATRNGCAPMLGAYRPKADPDKECVDFNNAVIETIRSNPSIRTVILAARWAIYVDGNRYKNESGKALQLIDQDSIEASAAESVRVAQRALTRTINQVNQLGRNVVVIAGIPEVGWDTPRILAKSAWYKRNVSIAPSRIEHELRQRQINQLLASLSPQQALVFRPDALLCPNEYCYIERDGDPLYVDDDHLSTVGTRLLEPLINEILLSSTTGVRQNSPGEDRKES